MAYATAHNGGRSQIGMNFMFTAEYPFINPLKMADHWERDDHSNVLLPHEVDSNGNPLVANAYTVFFVPEFTDRPGSYVMTWDGAGVMFWGIPGTVVSTPNRRVITCPEGTSNRIVIYPTSLPVSNIRVFHEDDETAINAGEIFLPKLIEKLVELKPGTIRFLDWQRCNTSTVVAFGDEKPESWFSWAATEFRSNIFCNAVSPTTKLGDDYTAPTPPNWPGALQHGQKAIVCFPDTVTSTAPRLRLGASDYKTIYSNGGTPLDHEVQRPVAGWPRELTYDSVIDGWLAQAGLWSGIGSGAPIEVCLKLCATVGAHPHFVTPGYAVDPMSDWVTELAKACKAFNIANNTPWMIPTLEGPNESWNGANLDFQNAYIASAKSQKQWDNTNDGHNWYGKIISTIGQAMSAEYGDDRTKYRVALGVQTHSGNPIGSETRFTSYKYVNQAAAAQSGYTKSPASDWVTSVAIANYINPTLYATPLEFGMAWDYFVVHDGNPTAQLAVLVDYVAALEGPAERFNLAACNAAYIAWKSYATSHGISELIGYEGGYSPDGLTDAGAGVWGNITGATKDASGCVLTIPTSYHSVVGTNRADALARVGMLLSLQDIGGMVELNGATGTTGGNPAGQVRITEVGIGGDPFKVRIDVNSLAFTTYTSGGLAGFKNSQAISNVMRFASREIASLYGYTATNYQNHMDAGGIKPSQFTYVSRPGISNNPVVPGTYDEAGQIWAFTDSLWATSYPSVQAVIEFNAYIQTIKRITATA